MTSNNEGTLVAVSRFYKQALDHAAAGEIKLSNIQQQMFSIGASLYRRHKNDAVMLAAIGRIPMDAWLDGSYEDETLGENSQELKAAGHAITENAKSDISNGKLIVRDPVTLTSVNGLDTVRDWCANSMGDFDDPRIANLVVKRAELIAWLDRHGTFVPAWLGNSEPRSNEPAANTSRQFDPMMEMLCGIAMLYGFDPKAARNKATGVIMDKLKSSTTFSDDTVRRWLKRAFEGKPPKNEEGRTDALLLILHLSKGYWPPPLCPNDISAELARLAITVTPDEASKILKEAEAI
ncbi:MAG: hypothetical protein J0I91_09535 [Candidatus Accumulibacter sp.]|nr:hypothetical protein [Accumulibacter sp.]